ncbi:TlpA family protein disulfide reductase [Hymenobacter rubidus]|uniref:TlpA family protein disulfide reductase n=1 Tax=Hymenobacter rubidus TaxID=1441626 RepID=UPI00191EBA5B|nr:TlpA disulfide reductase family protein [Hymenobacter rubidus]
MKNTTVIGLLAGLLALGLAPAAWAQSGSSAPAQAATPNDADLKSRKLPAVSIRTLDGKSISTAALPGVGQGKPVIISFWATWCKPCIAELTNIHELFPDLQAETGAQLIAISIDDARNAAKVGPLTKGRGWTYPVYLDQNQDLKRALNVNNIPHTFLLDGAGNIVWQHNAYNEGDENHLLELVHKVAKGEKISQ